MQVDRINIEEVSRREYSAFLAAVGYEQRGRYACQQLKPIAVNKTAPAFAERQTCAFQENRRWFSGAEFNVEVVKDDDVGRWSQSWLAEVAKSAKKDLIIGIDVSSMSRLRLASMVAAIMCLDSPLL
jgi:hypothetical protein